MSKFTVVVVSSHSRIIRWRDFLIENKKKVCRVILNINHIKFVSLEFEKV